MPRLVLIVPCYNEADRLPVDRFVEFASGDRSVAFIFVNDGSADATPQIVNDLVASDKAAFSALSLATNCGKAEAVRRGLLAAIKREPDYIGYWDADLSTPLDEIPRFLACFEQMPDRMLVTGARVKLMGRDIERRAVRHYAGRAFATLVSLLLDIEMYDTQCGAKVLPLTPLTASLFDERFHSRWLFDLEILLRLRRLAGERGLGGLEKLVYELPLVRWRDVSGSKIGFGYFLWAVFDLFGVRLRYRGWASVRNRPWPRA